MLRSEGLPLALQVIRRPWPCPLDASSNLLDYWTLGKTNAPEGQAVRWPGGEPSRRAWPLSRAGTVAQSPCSPWRAPRLAQSERVVSACSVRGGGH